MKELVSISEVGSIRILDVPLGVEVAYVKQVLRTFDLQENNNCLYLKDISIDNLPNINIHFNKDNDGRIDRIYIGQSQLNQKECDRLFRYFENKLSALNLFSKKEDEVVLSNTLHRVTIGKQRGIGDNENKYPFFLNIIGRLMGNNEPQLKYAMRQLYLERGAKPINKTKKHISMLQMIKVLFLILALIVAFLFALNGRYIKADEQIYFDKWKKTLILLDDSRFELIK